MKKAKTALAVLIMGLMLSGCSPMSSDTGSTPTQSSIYITGDGIISSVLVEPSDQEYYDQEELKASIQKEVEAYNTELGRTAVTLSSCTLGSGKATAWFQYENGSDLCAFTKQMEDTANQAQELSVSTVDQGLSDRDSGLLWKKGRNGAQVSGSTVRKNGDWKLITVDGTVRIQTEDKIQYYSGNVSLLDGHTADIGGGTAYLIFK